MNATLISLESAVVVVPEGLSGPEARAVTMLVEEVERRSQIRWPVSRQWPPEAVPVIAVGPASARDWPPIRDTEISESEVSMAPEGYRITVNSEGGAPAVFVIGS